MRTPAAERSEKDRRKLQAMLDREGLTLRACAIFRRRVYSFYREEGRVLPWRLTRDPYRILVSEFMLQQTQVERVQGKYEAFIAAFPDLERLAEANLAEVLTVWQGLGYNRRAKALLETARLTVSEGGGGLPEDPERLEGYPGVGKATAGAVAAFAFGRPAVFLETNIRRVFIHLFFPGAETIRDRDILPLVERTLDRKRPRKWYYALMDYGVMLKKAGDNPNRKSAHYQRQSPFEGSDREVRSRVLRVLLQERALTEEELVSRLPADPVRSGRIIRGLEQEGFLACRRGRIVIA